MIYGYARVSSKGQDLYGNGREVQEDELRGAGADKIYYDCITGTKKSRPNLDAMMRELREGDEVVVTKLDRIARSVRDGIDIIESIVAKGCKIRVMNMGMFDNSPTGRMIRNVLLSFAEFERDMIEQRTREGKAIARSKEGYKEGRPKKDVPMFSEYYAKNKSGEKSAAECCAELGITKSKWYRLCNEERS